MISRAAAFALGLCACAGVAAASDAQQPPPPALSDLAARVRLLEVKSLEAYGAISALIHPRRYRFAVVSPGYKGEMSKQTQLFQKLYLSATQTGNMLEFVCTDDALKPLCGPKFGPAWLSDPASLEPTTQALSSWIGETEAALDPFWRDVCTLARTKTQNAELCPDPSTVKLPWDEPTPPPPV